MCVGNQWFFSLPMISFLVIEVGQYLHAVCLVLQEAGVDGQNIWVLIGWKISQTSCLGTTKEGVGKTQVSRIKLIFCTTDLWCVRMVDVIDTFIYFLYRVVA